MNFTLYYHILEIGVVYEKGKRKGILWRPNERKRLQDECMVWEKILKYATEEKKGTDHSIDIFKDLQDICKKYYLPNYERVLDMQEELLKSKSHLKIQEIEMQNLNAIMDKILEDVECNIKKITGKKLTYRLLETFHNLPRALHATDELGDCISISYKDAVRYASWSLPKEMRDRYKKFFE